MKQTPYLHLAVHDQDPEKRKTHERLAQAINEARDRGDIELLDLIAEDPQGEHTRPRVWISAPSLKLCVYEVWRVRS